LDYFYAKSSYFNLVEMNTFAACLTNKTQL